MRRASRAGTVTKRGGAAAATGARGGDVVAQLEAIEHGSGSGLLTFGGSATLSVSSLAKPYFPADGFTKGDVMRYYATVAPIMLPLIADRPLVLRRFPEGIRGQSFYQQVAPAEAPEAVRVESVRTSGGVKERRLVGGDLATLLYTVQLGAIDTHPWLSRLKSIHFADYAVLDLDPGPRTPFAGVVRVAQYIRALLQKAGRPGAIKTSGSRGLHIFIPLPPRTAYAAAQDLAQTIATGVAEAHPAEATVARMIAKRPPKTVYVDYLQNAEGKSVAAPFSVRARAGATVSTPLSWSEVTESLDPSTFTIATVPKEARRRGLLWQRLLKG